MASGEGWDQAAGGPGREGAALLLGAPYDVLGGGRVLGDNELIFGGSVSPPLLETPSGLVGVAVNTADGSCTLVRVMELAPLATERIPLDGCSAATLHAYDAADDALVVCNVGPPDAPILQSRDARTGALRWAVRPVPDLGASRANSFWGCQAAALERGNLTVAFMGRLLCEVQVSTPLASQGICGQAENRVARMDAATGKVTWKAAIGTSLFYERAVGAVEDRALGGQKEQALFQPNGIALTSIGVIVNGYFGYVCDDPRYFLNPDPSAPTVTTNVRTGTCLQGAAAWLTSEGAVMGGLTGKDADRVLQGPDAYFGPVYGSDWAATSGALGAFALSGNLVLVNPREGPPLASRPIDAVESSRGYAGVTAPKWWENTLVVPLSHSITAYDSGTLEKRWSWTDGPEYDVSDILLAPPGDAYVLVGRPTTNEGQSPSDSRILRLDLATGHVLQRLPMPEPTLFSFGRWQAKLLPLSDGRLLVRDTQGIFALLGPAPADMLPSVRVSTNYPAPGESVTLQAEGSAGRVARLLTISWGEGQLEDVQAGQAATHRYAGVGVRTLRVTAVYDDNTTATSERLIRVGEPAPVELNALQQAFAPDNQNLTFGALGIALTGIAALVAVLARRRKKTRLGAELGTLERIRERSGTDALGAVHELEAFRQRVLLDVAEGRLDDAQFSVLELRVTRLLQALRLRLLGPFAGRVTDQYRHLLEAALEDGQVSAEEAARLRHGLARERRLTKPEKERLAGLIGLWQRSEGLAGS